jgi:hypothetical protein
MRARSISVLLVASLAAACGKAVDSTPDDDDDGDDGTVPDASVADATPDPPDAQPVEQRGFIEAFSRVFTDSTGTAVRDGRVVARFGSPEDRSCEIGATDGECILQVCAPRGQPDEAPDAGSIAFLINDAKLTDLVPGANGLYPAYEQTTLEIFTGGEKLTVTAAGGDVPEFTIDLAAPAALAIDAGEAPTSTTTIQISAANGHSLRWPTSAPPADRVRVTLSAPPDGKNTRKVLECSALATSGGFILPTSLLSGLPTGLLEFEARVETEIEVLAKSPPVGTPMVTFLAAGVATDVATGDWAKGMVDLVP